MTFSARTACALVLLTPAALAQWSDDPAVNTAVADRPGEQVLPKIAGAADGCFYVSWFDHASGNYDVYLQRYDGAGNELWPHNGVLVSAHPSLTSLTDWDLLCDAENHAVLVFSDARDGTDLDVHAYRVAPDGQMVWGPDGITLSSNADYEPSPRVAQADDGDILVAWARLPNPGDGRIVIQRIDPAGNTLYGTGIEIAGAVGEDPAFCDVVAADSGAFVVAWVRDISTFSSPRHLRAQKFDAAGAPQWGAGPVAVFDAGPLPIAYYPIVQPDGAGGAYFCWHASIGSYDSWVQHVDASGTELFGHNGVQVSLEANRHIIDPTLSVVPSTGELVVFWDERNLAQSQWGISAQKLSPAGAREWGNDGVELLAVDGTYKRSPRSVPHADGARVFLFREPTLNQPELLSLAIDGNGAFGAASTLCSIGSAKDKLAVITYADGVARACWSDKRNDANDVYAQDLNPDGTLGFGGGCLAVVFCQAAASSVSSGALISASGSTSIAANDFALTTELLPPNAFGRYFYGPNITSVAFGNGIRCVGNGFFRLPPQNADGNGSATLAIDYGALPPLGPISAGESHNFQFWYRNPAAGGANFNASNAIHASFCP